jgi:amidohydrolase
MSRPLMAAALGLILLSTQARADPLAQAIAADLPTLVALYTDLHRTPELSFAEEKTAAKMAAQMRRLGFVVTEKVGGHGVVAVLKNGPGPTLLLRADMDGLPVPEQTGLAYASTVTTKDGQGNTVPVMHACGHDIHMTVLIGTARRLVAQKADWSGTLVLIAQPAEEVGSGAKAMLADGLFERFPRPDLALALHVNADLPAGQISVAPGFAFANVDSVDVTARGVGGHGAYPHTTRDPVVLASQIVVALQTLVSRNTNPLEPAVVTVGSIHGGTKHNIIPDEVKLQLTVRSYSDEVRAALLDGIARIARGQALAAGVPEDRLPIVAVQDQSTPSTFNTDGLSATVLRVAKARLGDGRVRRATPVMGGEDFGRYWRADKRIESTIFWLGAVKQASYDAAKAKGTSLPSLHSPFFAPDPEPTLKAGIDVMTSTALDVLRPGK